ncbi:unnamed protein product [Didymodactylos carnosus]|uniref:Uncharacterized protein n=1 Tax=Didymodactylos carnosus TaxID=1234261 RepID=A0A815C652_9BILA|nr:unnamed protein product [Didymodactylos carnosus]CAF4074121.1 unnamed protein product [Didymodactylos carnosus]
MACSRVIRASKQAKKACAREMNEINKKSDDFFQKCEQKLKAIQQQIQKEMLKVGADIDIPTSKKMTLNKIIECLSDDRE